MRKFLVQAIILLAFRSAALANVPGLQLFIDGAHYDRLSQTWVTNASGFDLYVVSSGHVINDVIVSVAVGNHDDPSQANINFGGHHINSSEWVYGFPPIDNTPEQFDPGDLPRHRIYPTWFTEMHTGAYSLNRMVGETAPDANGNFWNPATGVGQTQVSGDIKMFHINAGGSFSYVHFDAYAERPDGTIWKYAPYSHDAEMIASAPEPGTLAMLGIGLLGLGAYRRKRAQ